jgi:hypothetical protein
MEDRELYNGRRGGVPSARVTTVLGMALQCPKWWHNDGDGRTGLEGDRGDALHHPHVMASSWVGTGSVFVRFLKVPPSFFEGCGVEEGREWAAQCHGVTPAIPHSTRTASGMVAQRRVGRTAPGSESQAVSGDRCGGDSPLTQAPVMCQSF